MQELEKLKGAALLLETSTMINAPQRAKEFARQAVTMIDFTVNHLLELTEAVEAQRKAISQLQGQVQALETQSKGRVHG